MLNYILVFAMLTVYDVSNGEQTETCKRVMQFVNDLGLELTQGPPRMMGPRVIGNDGQKGEKGEIGETPQCSCSVARMNALEERANQLAGMWCYNLIVLSGNILHS